ncbi:MAG: uroporphyrinogen decarboxylase family protein [Promethearchaeota archaeon]
MTMSKLERIDAVTEGREPDVAPVYPFIMTQAIYANQWKIADVLTNKEFNGKKSADAILNTIKWYDYDLAIPWFFHPVGVNELGGEMKIPDKFGEPPTIKEYPVKTAQDWEDVQKKLPLDPHRDGMIPGIIESTRIVAEKAGKETALCSGVLVGPTAACYLLRKIDDFNLDLARNPDFATELIKAANDFNIDLLRAQYEAGSNSIADLWDVFGVELISPAMSEKILLPSVAEISKAAEKEFGKKTWLHSHGEFLHPKCYPVVEKFIKEAKICGWHGDHRDPAGKLKEMVGKKYNIMTAMVIGREPATWVKGPVEKIENEVKTEVKDAAAGGGVIFTASCEIPPPTPGEYIKALVKFARTYCKYPIS